MIFNAAIPAAPAIVSVVYNSSNNFMYVRTFVPITARIRVIDCNTNTVIATITGMTNVLSILYIPNSTTLLVGSQSNYIYKINCTTNTITCSYNLSGNFPSMTYNTNDNLVYVVNYSGTSIKRFSIT